MPPWEKYQGSKVVASAPPMPKAPAGYDPGSDLSIDPGYMRGEVSLAGAKAGAAAGAAGAKEKDVAAFKARLAQQLLQQRMAAELDKAKQIKGISSTPSPEKAASLDALSRQLEMVRNLYNKNFKGGNILSSAMEFLPTPKAQEFNSAAAGLSDQALAAFRTPGVGSQSDRELQAFVSANQPSNTDYDRAIEQKMSNIENRLVSRRKALGLPAVAGPLSGAPRKGQAKQSRVIDFNDLPE